MSETKPPPKDRTALYIAIVGASATIVAALIGVVPNILKSTPTPDPIVVTATSIATQAAQATLVLSTATALPPDDTPVPPTLTLPPAPTTEPTASEIISPTVPALPAATRTPSSVITLFVINNLHRPMEFFVDSQSAAKINSGGYLPLKVPRGEHELKQCILGSDYSDPNNCFARTYDLAPNPDVWEMFDSSNPLNTETNISYLILNRANTPQDLFIDGQLTETVQPGDSVVVPISAGQHTVQPCAPGFQPPNPACGQPFQNNFFAPTHWFIINGESS